MEPLQVCPSQHGGPHAILTKFGWILGGLKNERGRCQVNRIKVDMSVVAQQRHLSDCLRVRRDI